MKDILFWGTFMRHFQHHRTNAQIALKARLGKVSVNDLTTGQAVMFSQLTLHELEELALIGRHELA
ncbi:hypothetical protein [Pseudooctadecabacter sp.]|uniref:hypothetical protein n=1 Tax=Pseudooctadecabacter sp. TaxID=1966338 RepID=UPI0025F870E9|nr:hypothetical protein [Pseudooctadecabacter sp.]